MPINPTPLYAPSYYVSAYNPIIWSFLSDKATTTYDFRYIVDIYIYSKGDFLFNAVLPHQTFVIPNSTGVGMIDISPFVQNELEYNRFSAEEGTPSQYVLGDYITATAYLLVGEEYRLGPSASLIKYSGNGTAVGPPDIYFGADIHNAATPIPLNVNVIPSALIHNEQTKVMTLGLSSSYLAQYACIGTYGIFTQSYVGKFLKRDSNTIEVGNSDRHTLAHINLSFDKQTIPESIVALNYQVNSYDNVGALLNTSTYSAFNPAIDPITNGCVLSTFRCGPIDLGLSLPICSYYDVLVNGFLPPTGYATASETVRFNIVDYCEDLYPKIRLSWLNDLGGRDYYNFTMFYEQSSNSIEKNYNQSTMNWNQATPVVIPGNSIDSSSNWRRGGNKSFNKNVVRRFTIQSDYLDQEKVDFLSAVPESPSVWAYIGTQSVPYTVTVTNTEYTNKYVKQQKLVQVSFDCTLTKTQQKQNS